jgi:CheY-like chemotaxis protein
MRPSTPDGSAGGESVLKIVLVDNDEPVRRLWREMLHRRFPAAQIVEAGDGGEAICIAQECQPDVVLMDLNMPGLDGLAASKRLKEDGRTRWSPVIAVIGSKVSSQGALVAGYAGYVIKPLTSDQLVEAILRVVRRPLRVRVRLRRMRHPTVTTRSPRGGVVTAPLSCMRTVRSVMTLSNGRVSDLAFVRRTRTVPRAGRKRRAFFMSGSDPMSDGRSQSD